MLPAPRDDAVQFFIEKKSHSLMYPFITVAEFSTLASSATKPPSGSLYVGGRDFRQCILGRLSRISKNLSLLILADSLLST